MAKRFLQAALGLALAGVALLASGVADAGLNPGQVCSGLPGRCLRISFNNDSINVPIIGGNDTPGPAENITEVSVGTNKWVLEFVDQAVVYCVGVSADGSLNVLTKDCSGPDPAAYGTVWNKGDNGLLVNQRVSGLGNGQYALFVSRTVGDRATLVPNAPSWTAGNGGTSFRQCHNNC